MRSVGQRRTMVAAVAAAPLAWLVLGGAWSTDAFAETIAEACSISWDVPGMLAGMITTLANALLGMGLSFYTAIVPKLGGVVFVGSVLWLVFQGAKIVFAFGDPNEGKEFVQNLWIKMFALAALGWIIGEGTNERALSEYVFQPIFGTGASLAKLVLDAKIPGALSMGEVNCTAEYSVGDVKIFQKDSFIDLVCSMEYAMNTGGVGYPLAAAVYTAAGDGWGAAIAAVFTNIFLVMGATFICLAMSIYFVFVIFRIFMLIAFAWTIPVGLAFQPFRDPAKAIISGLIGAMIVIMAFSAIGQIGVVLVSSMLGGLAGNSFSSLSQVCLALSKTDGKTSTDFYNALVPTGGFIMAALGVVLPLLLNSASALASMMVQGAGDILAPARQITGAGLGLFMGAMGAMAGGLAGGALKLGKGLLSGGAGKPAGGNVTDDKPGGA